MINCANQKIYYHCYDKTSGLFSRPPILGPYEGAVHDSTAARMMGLETLLEDNLMFEGLYTYNFINKGGFKKIIASFGTLPNEGQGLQIEYNAS